MTLLWEEYRARCYENGKVPYQSTQFGEKYRRWARLTKATMRIQQKPGDAMDVDWAGDTIPVFDPVTGVPFPKKQTQNGAKKPNEREKSSSQLKAKQFGGSQPKAE